MTTDELLIHELATRAGISVRTIRYYIEEGLLPQPNYQGKYSYYSLDYLDRLELIRRLKDSYLPLREIREVMSSLTDAEVRRRLKELSPKGPKSSPQLTSAQPGAKPGAKALQYINTLMEDQTRYKTKGTVDQNQSAFVTQKEMAMQSPTNPPPESSPINEEHWQRTVLAPGVELHVRKPMDPTNGNRVQQLIDFANNLFHIKS